MMYGVCVFFLVDVFFSELKGTICREKIRHGPYATIIKMCLFSFQFIALPEFMCRLWISRTVMILWRFFPAQHETHIIRRG